MSYVILSSILGSAEDVIVVLRSISIGTVGPSTSTRGNYWSFDIIELHSCSSNDRSIVLTIVLYTSNNPLVIISHLW